MNRLLKMTYLKIVSFVSSFDEDNLRRLFTNELSYKSWLDDKLLEQNLLPLYKGVSVNEIESCVCFMSDDKWVSGGLCDKLRGIVSLYLVCTQLKVRFRIYWVYPFCLSDYLIPNNYNWLPEEIIQRSVDCLPIQSMSYRCYFDVNEMAFQRKSLYGKIIKHKKFKQLHVYTNAHFCNDKFSSVFHELFKPSFHLQQLINKYIPEDQLYISMSFRFQQLLGDFKDRSGGETLSESQKREYINDSLRLIEEKHIENRLMKVLVSSDSYLMLNAVKQLEYVFIIPGRPKHSDLPSDNFDKEFLDLFAISKAQRVFLCVKGVMYSSGFPYYASLIGRKPFEIIEY